MTYTNMVARMAGVSAFGLAMNLSMETASAQNLSTTATVHEVYAPPPPSASVYHPEPRQPYVMMPRPSGSAANPGPVLSERLPWWELQEGRFGFFIGLSILMIGLAGGILYVIDRHEKESGS